MHTDVGPKQTEGGSRGETLTRAARCGILGDLMADIGERQHGAGNGGSGANGALPEDLSPHRGRRNGLLGPVNVDGHAEQAREGPLHMRAYCTSTRMYEDNAIRLVLMLLKYNLNKYLQT